MFAWSCFLNKQASKEILLSLVKVSKGSLSRLLLVFYIIGWWNVCWICFFFFRNSSKRPWIHLIFPISKGGLKRVSFTILLTFFDCCREYCSCCATSACLGKQFTFFQIHQYSCISHCCLVGKDFQFRSL